MSTDEQTVAAPRPRGTNRTRRRFLKRAAVGAGALLAGSAGWASFLEPRWIRVRHVSVPLPGLPPALDGFTIGQLSDLHAGPHVSPRHIRRGIETVASLECDLIVLTGDFVWGGAGPGEVKAEHFASLRARHGVFAVLGNHDYWSGRVNDIRRELTRAGIRVLVNESVPIKVKETRWWLGGVDDLWSGAPDVTAAFVGAPAGAFRILLCHEPDFADQAAAAGLPLQLSGHSHGGQVRLPFLGAMILPQYGEKYPIGLQRIEPTDSLVYTNVGLGLVPPLVRFRCPPEVTRLTLVSAGSQR